MPVYEYKCPECDHVFDKLQSYSAAPPECPKCGHGKTEKQITAAAGCEFKGDGYYKGGSHTW